MCVCACAKCYQLLLPNVRECCEKDAACAALGEATATYCAMREACVCARVCVPDVLRQKKSLLIFFSFCHRLESAGWVGK